MGRQNTIRIDYGALPNKPTMQKVQNFCAEKLGLKRGEVIRIQNSQTLGVTFVTVVDLALALKVCEEHGHGHELTGNDKKLYPVTVSIEDGTVLVKLFDLSTDVSNDDIAKFLDRYGDVRDVYEQQLGDDQEFAGAYTGVRIAKMVVRENIASWITINGEQTKVSYYGQRHTCKHCHDFQHVGVGCVQNKKLLVQKSFADAVKLPAATTNNKAKPQPQPPKPKGDGKKKAEGPTLPKNSVDKSKPPKPTDEGNGSSFDMPPPAGPVPSGSGLLAKSFGQQPPAGGVASGNPSGKPDGYETDSSTSSRKSTLRSQTAKKIKYNENDDNEQEDGEDEI